MTKNKIEYFILQIKKKYMKLNKLFSILILLFGEALIIFCFLHFVKSLETSIMVLNIIVTSIIYINFFIDILFPIIDLKDREQKKVVSLGIKMFFSTVYALLAITIMVVCNTIIQVGFSSQLIFQGILFFVLLLGLYLIVYAEHKTHKTFSEENQNRGRVDEMKKNTREVMLKMEQMKNIPTDIYNSVNGLFENLRFISISSNKDAIELEKNYLNEIAQLKVKLTGDPIDVEKIREIIANCERIYKERKQVYSN